MADEPVQLLVAAFQDEMGADAALVELKQAKKDKNIKVKDAAILRKDLRGELHVSESGDMSGTRGAVIGGLVGAGLAIMTGGATLALAGVSAASGGIMAKTRDTGFKDERLRRLGESLKPGNSAIIAVIEQASVADAEAELRKTGAEVVVSEMTADIAAQLEAAGVADSEDVAATTAVSDPEKPAATPTA